MRRASPQKPTRGHDETAVTRLPIRRRARATTSQFKRGAHLESRGCFEPIRVSATKNRLDATPQAIEMDIPA